MKGEMIGIELTKVNGDCPVWVPLNSIALIQPYKGLDNKEQGTEVVLNNNGAVHVSETYVEVVEELQSLNHTL